MPKLRLVRNLFVPDKGEVLEAGTDIDVSDDYAKDLIARGTAVTAEDAEAANKAANAPREGESVDEFEVNGNAYAHKRDAAGDFYTVNGEKASEDAFISAKQALVTAQAEQERQEAGTEVVAPAPPLNDTPVQNLAELTPEQAERDFQATGAVASNEQQV